MKKRTVTVGAIVAAIGIVTVGGLAAFGGVAPNPEARLPESVEVTQQMYEDAYATFEACMNAGGVTLAAKSTVGGVHEFSYLAEAQPVYDRCYPDFAAIDFRWQISQSYNSPTFDRYRECLTEAGIEPGKDAETILRQVEESIDVKECFEPTATG